jgi:predicted dinucleotide-binding enzyme
MNIGIVGAGNVGSALGLASVRAGHDPTISVTNPQRAATVAHQVGAKGDAHDGGGTRSDGHANMSLNMSNGWPWHTGWQLLRPTA